MYQVTKEIPFCYGHRLLNYDGKCKNLHGHNGVAEITLETDNLDQSGFVVDFSVIKQIVSRWIDDNFDHRLLLHKDDPVVEYLTAQGEPIKVLDVNPTAENIAKLIFTFVEQQGLPVVQVKLWETPSCYAVYSGPRHLDTRTAGSTTNDKAAQAENLCLCNTR
jgi:6-pyruvoyltetrahydropterin/6-carboxytetrahydropterin synthase